MNGKRRLLGLVQPRLNGQRQPQASAKATAPERQVVAMCGDGGFSMLMGDFLSLAQMKLPVKIVIFNNSVLGFVAMEMKAGAISLDGTELHDTNFARIAEAPAVSKVYALKKPPRWMKRCRPPSAPTVRCWSTSSSPKRNWRSRRRSSWSRPKALACICCGRSSAGAGDEVIELAKTNWLR
ncbi:thiamine pyrophosphate-dependent enzyme [Klebsiella pneumoniae subsp. pneumoniae]|nr:thiamine pyrophosphate-dependent enzyme [Klebsiella pneumoniae subsp. pneumoniae]